MPRVLIVGSGIAGQTLACALTGQGMACDVVELKPSFDIAGAGMYLYGNALRAFHEIGIMEEIVSAGWAPEDDCSIISDAAGNELLRARVPRLAGPAVPALVPIRRKVLHDILAGAVQRCGVTVRRGVTVAAIAESDSLEPVHVQFNDNSTGNYDLVVGADGVRSSLRSLLFPGVAPHYSGFSNWRVVLPRPAELTRPVWMMGTGKSFGIIPISADALYIAGVSKEPGNPRYERDDLPRLCRERFSGFGGLAPALLARVSAPEQIVYTPIEEVHLARPWHKGRTVLLGDAAHAGTPFWAQGAAMAVEDAVLLARLLARQRTSGEATEALLAEWTERRHDRCLFVQRGSMHTGLRSHSEAPGAREALLAYVRERMQGDMDKRYARLAEAAF
ncbi:MAG: hypothetical protein EXR27_03005 [Betaproteobacteria bacterium]|nr:hypothetical protein [Betaproteobacteria bacterium]